MSLKAFHVFFITLSILMLLMVGGWCFNNYRDGGAAGYLGGAGLCVTGCLMLAVYGRYFLRKFKHISYL